MTQPPDHSSGDEASGSIPDYARLHVWQIQGVRDVLLFAAIVGVFWIGYMLRAVTVPLLVALLLAYLFEPLIKKLCQHPRIRRVHAVSGLLMVAGGSFLLVLAIVMPLLIGQTIQGIRYTTDGSLHAKVSQLTADFVPETYQDEVMSIVDYLPTDITEKSEPVADTNPIDLPVDVWAGITILMEKVFGFLGALVQASLLAFLIPFYFFFFSLWFDDVLQFARSMIPDKNKTRTLDLLGKMDKVIAGFVRGRIVISLIMGLMLAVGWMICGVPSAITLGLVVGVFCAVPYLGVIGVPLAVGFLFVSVHDQPHTSDLWWVWVIVWPTVVFAIVQLVEGYVLTPMISGKATGLDPVTILVAVLAGGSVMGMYGMLLAIPLAGCGKILFTDVLLPRIRAWTEGKVSDPLPIGRD
ncbi:MAG: AI-2E family transporter [Planctomycetes bacterium]|nr:AI-2E family transporter [Planctomycetota bacterium]